MGLRPFSTNQLLGITAGCSILAAVICNAVLIPQSRPVSVSYPPSVSSQAETRSTPSPASSPGEGSLNGPESSGALVDINRAAWKPCRASDRPWPGASSTTGSRTVPSSPRRT